MGQPRGQEDLGDVEVGWPVDINDVEPRMVRHNKLNFGKES